MDFQKEREEYNRAQRVELEKVLRRFEFTCGSLIDACVEIAEYVYKVTGRVSSPDVLRVVDKDPYLSTLIQPKKKSEQVQGRAARNVTGAAFRRLALAGWQPVMMAKEGSNNRLVQVWIKAKS